MIAVYSVSGVSRKKFILRHTDAGGLGGAAPQTLTIYCKSICTEILI